MCEYFCSEIPAYSSFIGLDQTLISTHFPAIQCPIDQPLQSKWWPNKTEDIADMYARMRIAAEDLYSKYASDSIQVIIYSHAEPIGRLIEVLRKDAFNPGWPPWTENCGINRLQIHNLDEPADVTVLNDTEHLAKVGLISPIYQ
jgi:broad specificity phosphatase PhoE